MDLVGIRRELCHRRDAAASSSSSNCRRRDPHGWRPAPSVVLHFQHRPALRRELAAGLAGSHRSRGSRTGASTRSRTGPIATSPPTAACLTSCRSAGWTTRKTFPFPWDFPDVFSKEFEDNADGAATAVRSAAQDDPNLIGWFIGNEPHWARCFRLPHSLARHAAGRPGALRHTGAFTGAAAGQSRRGTADQGRFSLRLCAAVLSK